MDISFFIILLLLVYPPCIGAESILNIDRRFITFMAKFIASREGIKNSKVKDELNKQPTYYDLVYAVTKQVPKGRVTTYGAIADFLALGASRMVGWALNNCVAGDNVPAHRVVNRKGELSGRHHFPTPGLMQELLEAEGVRVEADRVVDFKTLFWHPSEGLGSDWEAF